MDEIREKCGEEHCGKLQAELNKCGLPLMSLLSNLRARPYDNSALFRSWAVIALRATGSGFSVLATFTMPGLGGLYHAHRGRFSLPVSSFPPRSHPLY